MAKKVKKSKKFSELEEKYKRQQNLWKMKIRLEPNKWKRFWKWVWYIIAFPWVWLWTNIRDWRTLLLFLIVCAVISCEVWVPYLIAFICWGNTTIRYSMLGVGSACWLYWAGPGSPFLLICIGITIGIKALFNKIRENKIKKQKIKEQEKNCPYLIEKDKHE